jgi:molybdopterin-guanine dinucleotide biosynthesis protein A
MEALGERGSIAPTHSRPRLQPVVRYYTDWATPAPCNNYAQNKNIKTNYFENASVVRSRDENPTRNSFTNYIRFSPPVDASSVPVRNVENRLSS